MGLEMSRRTTRTDSHLRELAALAAVLGAVLISAAPVRADHRDVHVGFFFGLPFPPIPVPVSVYEPPRYYEPEVVYEEPPVYDGPRAYYDDRPAYWHRHWRDHDYWRGHEGRWHDRGWHRGHDRDDDDD